MFCDTQEANRLSSEKKLPMEIAGSSMISPEDHARYFELLVRVTMSRQSAGSDLLKVAVGNNEVCLCIYRLQSITIPELGDAIGWTARWERAPPSRHVNMRPGHRHRVVNTFRQSGGSHTMGDTESSSAGTGPSSAQSSPTQDIPAGMAIPGVASIPLPPIQPPDIERLVHVAQTVGMPARASPKPELQAPARMEGDRMMPPPPSPQQQQQQQPQGACVLQQQQWHRPPHDAGGGGGGSGGGGMAPPYEADDDRFMLDDETLDMLLDTTREHT